MISRRTSDGCAQAQRARKHTGMELFATYRDVHQLHDVTNGAHHQETHADGLADLQELDPVS